MASKTYLVAVIGAGPAGLYAAHKLAQRGARVVLFNRDIKPGGLAEYGIYYDKYAMKAGLRKQFQRFLATPGLLYLGHITVGRDLSLDDLKALGFQALLVTTGAQGTKSLGLPGEDLEGVYHAKELVFHYNHLPPFTQRSFSIGRRVGIIGVGNVMADIATYLIRDLQVDEVYAIARRGPLEVKFDKKEFRRFARNLDVEDFEREIQRIADRLRQVGQDPEEAKKFILGMAEGAAETSSPTVFRFRFLSSPKRILGDENGRVRALELEDTALVWEGQRLKSKGLGTTSTLAVDTVIFSIGDQVDPHFGLPVRWGAYATHPHPRFPVDGVSYEAYDPVKEAPIEGVFVAGWARQPSTGLVGMARKDGERAAEAVWQYLQTLDPVTVDLEALLNAIRAKVAKPVVTQKDLQRLAAAEKAEAEKRGLPEFKFDTNEAMLEAMGLRVKSEG